MPNTGYIIYHQKDYNPRSPYYGTTKEIRSYNTEICPNGGSYLYYSYVTGSYSYIKWPLNYLSFSYSENNIITATTLIDYGIPITNMTGFVWPSSLTAYQLKTLVLPSLYAICGSPLNALISLSKCILPNLVYAPYCDFRTNVSSNNTDINNLKYAGQLELGNGSTTLNLPNLVEGSIIYKSIVSSFILDNAESIGLYITTKNTEDYSYSHSFSTLTFSKAKYFNLGACNKLTIDTLNLPLVEEIHFDNYVYVNSIYAPNLSILQCGGGNVGTLYAPNLKYIKSINFSSTYHINISSIICSNDIIVEYNALRYNNYKFDFTPFLSKMILLDSMAVPSSCLSLFDESCKIYEYSISESFVNGSWTVPPVLAPKYTTGINLPNVKFIYRSFLNEDSILSYVALDNVEYIGEKCFGSTYKLHTFIAPKLVTFGGHIGEYRSLSQPLTVLELPSLKVLNGEIAIYGKFDIPNLEEVYGNFYTNYGILSFSKLRVLNGQIGEWDYLHEVYLPSLEILGNAVFSNFYYLSYVSVPKLKSIGAKAFGCCSSLTNIKLPNIEFIGYNAFLSCNNLKSIYVPSSMISLLNGQYQSKYVGI